MNNGASVVNLSFFGSYSQANFKFASDGHGGTIVYDPPVVPSGAKGAASVESLLAGIHNDTHGSSIFTDATHDIVHAQEVVAAQSLAHHTDTYLV